MIILDELVPLTIAVNVNIPYPDKDILYFDIETTGFSPINTSLYLIGAIYLSEDGYHIRQWFADTQNSERDILISFIEFLHNFKALVHYNGTGFDIPYIIKKCHFLKLTCDFENIDSIDIYKIISPLKGLLKLENLKQKSIETFLGINREDRYNGGELIHVYHQYLLTKDEQLKQLLLLHNHDDLLGMTQILPIMNYTCLIQRGYQPISLTIHEDIGSNGIPIKELLVELALDAFLPKRISFGNSHFYCTAGANTAKLSIRIYTDELKYFYPNYKDYYYLPAEDRSIHKSVAFYVDKEFRTKAKAANCYSKKTGVFLPQYDEIISPYFKIDYYDHICYFEYTEEFQQNEVQIQDYLNHIFRILM